MIIRKGSKFRDRDGKLWRVKKIEKVQINRYELEPIGDHAGKISCCDWHLKYGDMKKV